MADPTVLSEERRRWALLGFVGALAVTGCAVTPAGRTPPAGTPQAPAPAPGSDEGRPPALMVERQWLQSWFRGTPVRIAQRGDGPLTIEVPLEFGFEPGRTRVLPALAAVLDKVAESLRRVSTARLVLIAAPGDGAQTPKLAAQRAGRVRAHLLSRGVPPAQLASATSATGPTVILRMQEGVVSSP